MNLKQTKYCLNKICKFLANKPIYKFKFISNDMLEMCASHSAIKNHIVISVRMLKLVKKEDVVMKETIDESFGRKRK